MSTPPNEDPRAQVLALFDGVDGIVLAGEVAARRLDHLLGELAQGRRPSRVEIWVQRRACQKFLKELAALRVQVGARRQEVIARGR